MKKSRFTGSQILAVLRQAEVALTNREAPFFVLIAKAPRTTDACRKLQNRLAN